MKVTVYDAKTNKKIDTIDISKPEYERLVQKDSFLVEDWISEYDYGDTKIDPYDLVYIE